MSTKVGKKRKLSSLKKPKNSKNSKTSKWISSRLRVQPLPLSMTLPSKDLKTNWFFMHPNHKKLLWDLGDEIKVFTSFSSMQAKQYIKNQKEEDNPIIVVLMQHQLGNNVKKVDGKLVEEKETKRNWIPLVPNRIRKTLIFEPECKTSLNTYYKCRIVECLDCRSMTECKECQRFSTSSKPIEEHLKTFENCYLWPYVVESKWIEDQYKDVRDMPSCGFHFKEKNQIIPFDLNALMTKVYSK